MTDQLERSLQSYFGVAAGSEVSTVLSFFRQVSLPKYAYFSKEGSLSDRMGFVQSGLIREFLHTEDKEVTKWIASSGYFVVDLAAFLFDQPTRWNLQAITDCELYVISREDYQRLSSVVPAWTEIEKRFLAKCFTVLEERVVSHLSQSAEERYDAFFAFAPALFHQVPLQYLASLLGMTPETFSRIRKKKAALSS